MDFDVVIAAGWVKTPEQLERACQTAATHVTVGSYTLDAREGNEGVRFAAVDGSTVNSMGMPNAGLDAVPWSRMREVAAASGKRLVVSIAPLSVDEALEMTACVLAWDDPPHAVEVNCGCPNVYAHFARKKMASFDPRLLEIFLSRARHARDYVRRRTVEPPAELWVKLSPYTDPELLGTCVKAAVRQGVDALVLTNTIPGVRLLDDRGEPLLTATGGVGGMGGRGLHELAVANVGVAHRVLLDAGLRESVRIVGCGGVCSRATAERHVRAGADAVAVASAYFEREDADVLRAITGDEP